MLGEAQPRIRQTNTGCTLCSRKLFNVARIDLSHCPIQFQPSTVDKEWQQPQALRHSGTKAATGRFQASTQLNLISSFPLFLSSSSLLFIHVHSFLFFFFFLSLLFLFPVWFVRPANSHRRHSILIASLPPPGMLPPSI